MLEKIKKAEMQKLIDAENGIDYCKNINLNGYAVYKDKSFISFRILTIIDKPVVVIEYLYIVNKRDFMQLLSWCVDFWQGNDVKYIYHKEHKRPANIIKSLTSLGFNLSEAVCDKWKHDWKSTNGFPESEIIEAYTGGIE